MNLSYKIATYVSLVLMSGLALVFYFTSSELATLQPNQPISPATFPRLVSILLVITCIISFFTTMKKENEEVDLVNFHFVIYTLLALILFIMVWQLAGYFYPLSFVFLTVLLYIYSDQENNVKKLLKSMLISLIVVLLTYLVFGMLLGVIF
jgi:hypothetical protein